MLSQEPNESFPLPQWVIPRNIVFDTMVSMQPFGREMPLSFIPEWILKTFHYRSAKDLAPKAQGLFEGTPVSAFRSYAGLA